MKICLSEFDTPNLPTPKALTMADRKVHVYVELDGDLHHVGMLSTRSNRGK